MTQLVADLIIDARWVIPVAPAGEVWPNHSIVIRGENIHAILPTEEAHRQYASHKVVELDHHAVTPGFVNSHCHAAMTLLRGLADDKPLMEWLKNHIWPAETRHVSADFVRDGTALACAEMLRGGTTCFNDMYFYPGATAEAADAAGMRAAIGLIAVDFPTPYASDADDYLNKGLAVRDAYRDNPKLSFCLAPHAPYTISDKTFGKLSTYAAQLDLPMHIHVHETMDEILESLKQHGVRPLERLARLGLLGPGLIAVHAVHLTEGEIDLLSSHACSVAHCPASNLKLASGIAPVSELIAAGVNVGIGTDGAASNNRLDMFEEMRLAALLAKGYSGRADVIPAHRALQMATLDGARALGLDERIGSLAPGKAADITAVSLSELETTPCYDPVSHIVYAAGRHQVTHVWVSGQPVVENRTLKTVDEKEIRARAGHWRRKISESASATRR